MAFEILLVRLFEIATLFGLFLLTLIVGASLVLLKAGLFITLTLLQSVLIVCGILLKPVIATALIFASQAMQAVGWSFMKTIDGFLGYGGKLIT